MTKIIAQSDRKIRIAIVGCGRISKKHFESIESHADQLQLVSICDTDPDILSANRKKYHLPTYLHLDEMMKKEDLDLAVLCTPSGLHAQQTEIVASHGVNVITEKPMATRWHDGLRMVKACDDAGVELFVVKQNRRNFTLHVIKNEIEKEIFKLKNMVNVKLF